jgi:hypothetical protein
MSDITKQVLAGIVLAAIILAVLWIIWGLITALLFCAVYFAGWLVNPPRFWKWLGTAGMTILKWTGIVKQ